MRRRGWRAGTTRRRARTSRTRTWSAIESRRWPGWPTRRCIDLHPWTSRLPDWWRPTYALIDIDPGERTTFEDAVTLAKLYRTALGHLGLRGFPEGTGKRGIQVWVPIVPRYTFDETRDWVMGLSQAVGARCRT